MYVRILALLAAALLGLVAVAAAPAGATRVVATEPVEEVLANPCTGETIVLAGELRVTLSQLTDGAGGYHEVFTIVPHQVTAVGTSGTRYRVPGGHADSFSTGDGRATSFTLTVMFNVVSEGAAANFMGFATVHVTVAATGDVAAELERIRIACRGAS